MGSLGEGSEDVRLSALFWGEMAKVRWGVVSPPSNRFSMSGRCGLGIFIGVPVKNMAVGENKIRKPLAPLSNSRFVKEVEVQLEWPVERLAWECLDDFGQGVGCLKNFHIAHSVPVGCVIGCQSAAQKVGADGIDHGVYRPSYNRDESDNLLDEIT